MNFGLTIFVYLRPCKLTISSIDKLGDSFNSRHTWKTIRGLGKDWSSNQRDKKKYWIYNEYCKGAILVWWARKSRATYEDSQVCADVRNKMMWPGMANSRMRAGEKGGNTMETRWTESSTPLQSLVPHKVSHPTSSIIGTFNKLLLVPRSKVGYWWWELDISFHRKCIWFG